MSLRMIEMVTSRDRADALTDLQEQVRLLGIWREPLDDDLLLVRVLIVSEKSEAAIQALEERFGGQPKFRLFIFEVQATLPQPDIEEEKKNGQEKDPQRVACEELVQELSEGAVVNRVYLLTVALSAVVAAIGLMRENVAVIIGAMVIAPLLAPNMTLALATTLGDIKLGRNALWVNAVGLTITMAIAVVVGLMVPFDETGREIASRTTVRLSDVALALAAGSAGALAFTTGLSAAVVGVMVAVALLPPLVAAGLLLGAGQWSLADGALLLVATNVICVNVAGVGTFLLQGVRPRNWWDEKRAKMMVRVASAIWLGLLGMLIAIIIYTRK